MDGSSYKTGSRVYFQSDIKMKFKHPLICYFKKNSLIFCGNVDFLPSLCVIWNLIFFFITKRNLNVLFNNRFTNLLLQEMTVRGSIEHSLQVFSWMKQQKNYCARNDIYNMMIRLHARHNRTDQARGLFFEMQEWRSACCFSLCKFYVCVFVSIIGA